MSFPLTWMLFLLPSIRALPLDIASSDSSNDTKHDADEIVVLFLVFCLLIYRIVFPVLTIIMSHRRVASSLCTQPSMSKIGVPKVNDPSVPQGTAEPFAHAPSDPEVGGSLSTPHPSQLAMESVPSIVPSACTDDPQESLESARLSTAGSIYSSSQHSLAPSDVTHYFPSDSDSEWNDGATFVAEVIPRN
ncbi:hypothetical protein MSAN_01378200 [Mycena sanguinolenta]|uniref:Uncharacterized protein n=1 Tax=Mycena sanguinolenta TaxID=230812 RepID=A0A8H6Y9I7_9AGAR|nr:hypothetical protein MSAN_01378200 [Mycena sanguinolenta]